MLYVCDGRLAEVSRYDRKQYRIIHMYTCTHMCVYVYICIYTHTYIIVITIQQQQRRRPAEERLASFRERLAENTRSESRNEEFTTPGLHNKIPA